jgi:hypothetical protein
MDGGDRGAVSPFFLRAFNKLKKFFRRLYRGCQKSVPVAERIWGTTLMPPAFLGKTLIRSGMRKDMLNGTSPAKGRLLAIFISNPVEDCHRQR